MLPDDGAQFASQSAAAREGIEDPSVAQKTKPAKSALADDFVTRF